MALGSGRSKVEDKSSALLQALALECSNRAELRDRLGRIFSWTTDMGTEMHLPLFETMSFEQLLPSWLHFSLESDLVDSDAEAAGGQAVEPQDAQPLIPRCLVVPGGLHITHNLQTDMHEKLERWDQFWAHLQPIARLLEDRLWRGRFLATCVRGSTCAEHEESFQSMGLEKLYTKRWQVVITCLTKLLPLEKFPILQQAWDEAKYLAGGDTDAATVARGVTAALASNLFCSYVYMVHSLHGVVASFEKWLESCPCHEHLQSDLKQLRRGERKRVAAILSDCPMKGKRAPELAAGSLEATLEKLENQLLQCFSEDQGRELSDDERSILTKDFEYGRVYLRFALSTKLSFWRKLPWSLCGPAHCWPSVASACAKACLLEYNESLANARIQEQHHHPLTLEFLQEGTNLRADVEQLASGGPISERLSSSCAPFTFVSVAERVVEGLHRNVKIAAKHLSLGPTKVSLAAAHMSISKLCQCVCVKVNSWEYKNEPYMLMLNKPGPFDRDRTFGGKPWRDVRALQLLRCCP